MSGKTDKLILIVDDAVMNLKYAQDLLKDNYKIALAKSGELALEFLSRTIPDLILLDIFMPGMDGFKTYEQILKNPLAKDVPIIFLTGDDETESELRGFRMGAMDFIKKPFVPEIMKSRISRVIEFDGLRKNLVRQVEEKAAETERVTVMAITAIAGIIDAKDEYTKGHAVRVSLYAEEIARRLGMSEEEISNIKYVALLHDIGKISIADSVLRKPGMLTEDEYDMIKDHTRVGADILKDLDMIKMASEGAKYHHERYDGTGYPSGKKGEEIPYVARIISIADAYDAMNSNRSYRSRLSKEEITQQLLTGSGYQFDPKIAGIMLDIMKDGVEFSEDDDHTDSANDYAEESGALIKKVLSEYTKEMKIAAQKDNLTELWNRAYMENEVNFYLHKQGSMGTMFMMDIDNFKSLNDTYGHIVGDAVLVKFAEILKEAAREEDIACRIGGDEFTLFFKGMMNRETAVRKANQIISTMTCALRDMNVMDANAGISVGISSSPADGSDFLNLYKNADRALYYVKQNGKSGFHFYGGEMNAMVHADKSVHVDLIYLKKYMEEKQYEKGVYQVEYEGFKNIYQFVARCIGRTKQNVQTLLFTVEAVNNLTVDVAEVQEAMTTLEQSIQLSLRRGDVANRFSSSQFIVILMDTTLENGNMVAKRIVKSYKHDNQNPRLHVIFDIQEIDKK